VDRLHNHHRDPNQKQSLELGWPRANHTEPGGPSNMLEKLTPNRAPYTPEQLNARLRFWVGITLAGTLVLTMVAVFIALLFIPQGPTMPETDKELLNLISPIVLFLSGTLSGVMISTSGKRDSNGDGVPDA
jgi:hypothetical protein